MSTPAAPEKQEQPEKPAPKVFPQSPDRNSPGAKPPDLTAPRVRRAEELEEAAKALRKKEKSS